VRHFLLSLTLVLTLAAAGAAQDLPNVEQFGPQVGDVVPAFSLTDQNGQTQTLESIMGPNGAMLVFNRSADW
jgi:cytochrome oxidase Cu insertion factor (SCO1/SenC/PrrC family)|tara:strand:- start:857 stop:1072 length:216 start_codon:yes stop_codon:yes gene_type:complete